MKTLVAIAACAAAFATLAVTACSPEPAADPAVIDVTEPAVEPAPAPEAVVETPSVETGAAVVAPADTATTGAAKAPN